MFKKFQHTQNKFRMIPRSAEIFNAQPNINEHKDGLPSEHSITYGMVIRANGHVRRIGRESWLR